MFDLFLCRLHTKGLESLRGAVTKACRFVNQGSQVQSGLLQSFERDYKSMSFDNVFFFFFFFFFRTNCLQGDNVKGLETMLCQETYGQNHHEY